MRLRLERVELALGLIKVRVIKITIGGVMDASGISPSSCGR